MLRTVQKVVAAFLLVQSLTGVAWAETALRQKPSIQAVFDQELFELAYSVFMANSSLPEALAVAERALETHPSNITWRVRAAQSAEWNGLPELALNHWFHLVDGKNQDTRQTALRLARALNEFPIRKKILEHDLSQENPDLELLREYLTVVEGLGLPQEAYDLLASGRITNNAEYVLTEQARLAETLGRPDDSAAAWNKLMQLRPLKPEENLKLASLWYGLGNSDNAWQVLLKGAQSAPPSAVDFWRTYADLAWARQETTEATRAARILLEQGKADEADYQRLIMVFQQSDPQQVYSVAQAGWKNFRTPYYWYEMAEAGLRTGREKELSSFLKQLGADEQKILTKDASSRMLMARIHHQSGNVAACLENAREAVRLAPENGEIVSSYLWLLIDLQRIAELRRLVRDWEWRIVRLPELREPLAAAMMLLGNPPRALQLYRVLAPERQNDPAWLASYGDVLEQAGHPEAAWTARRQAQLLLARQMQTAGDSPEQTRRDLLTKAQLLMHQSPGDYLSTAIQRIAGGKQDDFSRGLIMGWAMAGGKTDSARLWYWRSLARTAQRLEWALLGLALEVNDQPAIADLIESALVRLPYRDAVEGARRSGQTLLAETVAFEQFQISDQDHLLDKQVRDLFQAHPAAFRQRLSLQEQGGVGFLEAVVSFSYPVTKRLALTAEFNNTEIRHQKRDVVREYSSNARSGQLTLHLQHEKGIAALSAGVTDALYQFASAAITSDWRLYNRLILDLGFRYGWQATESVPLRIGGLKDEAAIGLLTKITPRDDISTRLTFQELRDQKRRYLGNGISFETEETHRLLLDWPDTNLRLFSGYHHFERSNTVGGRTFALIPVGAADDYYVPKSFAMAGLGINFGQLRRNTYSREWLPFGAADLSWNSVSGTGFRYELGLVGPVFGLDKLEGAFSQESGSFGSSDVNSRFDIRYLYNLN